MSLSNLIYRIVKKVRECKKKNEWRSGTAVLNRCPTVCCSGHFAKTLHIADILHISVLFLYFVFLFVCFVLLAWLAGTKGLCKLCIDVTNFNLLIDLNLYACSNTKEISSKLLSWYCSTLQRLKRPLFMSVAILLRVKFNLCLFSEGQKALNNSVRLKQLIRKRPTAMHQYY